MFTLKQQQPSPRQSQQQQQQYHTNTTSSFNKKKITPSTSIITPVSSSFSARNQNINTLAVGTSNHPNNATTTTTTTNFYPSTSNRQLDANSFDAATIPWQRIHHGNIPQWEQDRLLREVLMSMLLTDVVSGNNNNNMNPQQQDTTSSSPTSLHSRVVEAANEVMSNFVKTAIIGAVNNVSGISNSNQEEMMGSNSNQTISLGALKLPETISQNSNINNNNNQLASENETGNNNGNKWVTLVQDRRQVQLERLLNDSQSEVAILKQQLEDVTKAHDDAQRALNMSYHNLDSLQKHVLTLNQKQEKAPEKEITTTKNITNGRRSLMGKVQRTNHQPSPPSSNNNTVEISSKSPENSNEQGAV